MRKPMSVQSSCLDCYFNHPYSKCWHRQGRIPRLEKSIKAMQRELQELKNYDEKVASGELVEPVSQIPQKEREEQKASARREANKQPNSEALVN